MNFRYLILVLLLSCNQGPIEDMKEEEEVYRIVETMPVLAICNQFSKKERKKCTNDIIKSFIDDTKEYPDLAKQNNYEGTSIVNFIIERDGSVSKIKLVNDLKFGLGDEGLRIINLMAEEFEWVSGQQRGTPVRVRFTLPIVFEL